MRKGIYFHSKEIAGSIKESKLIIVKVGTNSISNEDGGTSLTRIKSLVRQIIELKNSGHQIVIVTSGAIGAGMSQLKMQEKPSDLVLKQACAAIGQSSIISYYERYFKEYGKLVAQVLLTQDDLLDKTKRTNIINTLSLLLKMDVIPIINENDVVSTNEIAPVEKSNEWLNFGDNDALSAAIACGIKANLLILLTDVDGLYDSYPINIQSKIIQKVDHIDRDLEKIASGKGKLGRGGMLSKITAAKNAMRHGIPTIIANGQKANILEKLSNGEAIGTLFRGK
ncbi:MAG: glutamate 5-kinase [Candidatus Bilamarchaeum sp.]